MQFGALCSLTKNTTAKEAVEAKLILFMALGATKGSSKERFVKRCAECTLFYIVLDDALHGLLNDAEGYIAAAKDIASHVCSVSTRYIANIKATPPSQAHMLHAQLQCCLNCAYCRSSALGHSHL